jgi:hypothetical protein
LFALWRWLCVAKLLGHDVVYKLLDTASDGLEWAVRRAAIVRGF